MDRLESMYSPLVNGKIQEIIKWINNHDRCGIEQELKKNCMNCISAKSCPAKGLKCNDYVKDKNAIA